MMPLKDIGKRSLMVMKVTLAVTNVSLMVSNKSMTCDFENLSHAIEVRIR